MSNLRSSRSQIFLRSLLGTIVALLAGFHLGTAAPRYQYLHLDHFDGPQAPRQYSPYHGETVRSWQGYGIYYEKAQAELQFVPIKRGKQALRITYDLPPHLDWGNWLSVRRELGRLTDLHQYEGLVLDVRTEAATNTQFRITLTDVANPQDASKHGADEMWWYDAPAGFLTPNGHYVRLYAPFRDFRLGEGAGVRIRDQKLDLSKIVAFEINLVSSGMTPGKGVVIVDCLRAYKRRPARVSR